MGIEVWNFPRLSELKTQLPSKGNRLIFPRDDFEGITITMNEPAGGVEPNVSDLFSSAGYIGWLKQGNYSQGYIPIKPKCDTMDLKYLYNKTWSTTEGIIDLGVNWQGFTDKEEHRILLENNSYEHTENDPIQYMTGSFKNEVAAKYQVLSDVQPEPPEPTDPPSPPPEKAYDTKYEKNYPTVIDGFLYRFAARFLGKVKGKIWRNEAGKILRNAVGKILRGDGFDA